MKKRKTGRYFLIGLSHCLFDESRVCLSVCYVYIYYHTVLYANCNKKILALIDGEEDRERVRPTEKKVAARKNTRSLLCFVHYITWEEEEEEEEEENCFAKSIV